MYAGISIVGNIVLFATSSVAGVLVASVNSGIAHIYNVRKLLVSFGLLVFMGSFVTALFSVAPTFFVTLLLGQRYSVYAYLLPKVALTMLFLSVANLFFAYHIALRDIYIVFVALASITIMITSVVVGHGNLTQMINSILYSSVIVVLINIVRTTWWNVRKLKAAT